MAYQPDDDRFYDSLNRAGQTYLQQRQRVAEDQAATTRELGQMYGQAMPNTVNAALAGASWAQNRGMNQQKMDLNQAQEGRSSQKFAEDQQDRQTALASAQKQMQYELSPAEEAYAKGAGVDFVPGMSHQDVERLAGARKLGLEDRKLEGENTRAANTLAGENQRSANTIAAENLRSGNTIAAENARQGNTLGFDREKLAQELALETGKMNMGKQAPAELVAKMGEADSAQKALENLGREWQQKASGKMATISQFLPNTEASRYDDAANINAQVVGKFLEEGKMTDADVPRYKAMLPTPTDTPTRAAEKLTLMSKMIAQKKAAHVEALRGAGYNVGPTEASGKGHSFVLDKEAPKENAAHAAHGEQPKAVIQNGHRYFLNEETGQYE